MTTGNSFHNLRPRFYEPESGTVRMAARTRIASGCVTAFKVFTGCTPRPAKGGCGLTDHVLMTIIRVNEAWDKVLLDIRQRGR